MIYYEFSSSCVESWGEFVEVKAELVSEKGLTFRGAE